MRDQTSPTWMDDQICRVCNRSIHAHSVPEDAECVRAELAALKPVVPVESPSGGYAVLTFGGAPCR